MRKIVERAKAFAIKSHEEMTGPGDERKNYYTHCQFVAMLVEVSGGNKEEIAAAWLHNVIKDNPKITIEDISDAFGDIVTSIVDGLTDLPDLTGLPKLEKKKRQAEKLKKKGDFVKRITLAEQIHNVLTLTINPPAQWNKRECLDYAEGAMLFAKECHGISDYLDVEFQKAYDLSVAIYS